MGSDDNIVKGTGRLRGEQRGSAGGGAAAQVAEWTGRSRAWRRDQDARKGRGAAARSPEVGKARHGENEGLGLWRPGLLGCQMTVTFGLGLKTTWGLWSPKGALKLHCFKIHAEESCLRARR
jgi:hypothetical protein